VLMAVLHAIILGILEGLTEFLPISSTGHLLVTEQLIGYHDIAELFTVVIQLGAIMAVIWHYWADIASKIARLFRWQKPAVRFWANLIIATIPAGLVGVALDKTLQKYSVPRTIAITLILGGIVLWLVDNYHKEAKKSQATEAGTHKPQLEKITTKQALGIGIAQIASLIPGTSRSGSTIVGGLLVGLDRVTATAFSFYLAIPVMILASGYKIAKEHASITQLPGGTAALIVGIVTSFITGLIAISWLLKFVAHHGFKPFAYYRIAVGILILILLATNAIS
jgi:undecaprenyl-diphosphatase